jgi:hypothetical protein
MELELTVHHRLLSRSNRIVSMLNLEENIDGLSCKAICDKLLDQELEQADTTVRERWRKSKTMYMSGSVSSVLRKLVLEGTLKYHPHRKSIRGGHIYVLASYDLPF